MTELEQLKQSLAEMQERLTMLEKEEKKAGRKSMLPDGEPIGVGGHKTHIVLHSYNYYSSDFPDDLFPDKETAEAYADAFRVMLELRRCEGSGEVDRTGDGWFYEIHHQSFDYNTPHVAPENFSLCPPFPSEEACEAAINKVGKERVIAAYKLLAGVKD